MRYAVIMAGGTGKRLWPLSRETRPKQVLKLIEGQTLLRRCFDRLTDLFDLRNIIVVTNAGYANIVRENLAELPYNNVIAEPVVRRHRPRRSPSLRPFQAGIHQSVQAVHLRAGIPLSVAGRVCAEQLRQSLGRQHPVGARGRVHGVPE